MSSHPEDVIAALASAPGPAPHGIVRVTGPELISCVRQVFQPVDESAWLTRRARSVRGTLRLPQFRAQAPARLHFWPTGRSYTGQPSAEIQTVGSPPLLDALLAELFRCGARPARPGEFTLRAFLAGRIDLTQAEAVLGVIDADGRAELETALAQLAGGLSHRLAPLRSDLLDLLADLEAGLDFVEEDIQFVSSNAVIARLAAARTTLESLVRQASDRIHTTGRRTVVLAGLPNAGKSTLFNVLAGREAAIVSPVAGTTRDWLRAEVEWDGQSLELIDTAGWETSSDALTAAGQAQRSGQLDRADLVVWCTSSELIDCGATTDAAQQEALRLSGRSVLNVLTKSDLVPAEAAKFRGDSPLVSASSGEGISQLMRRISLELGTRSGGSGQILGSTAARCGESLAAAEESLGSALDSAGRNLGDELIALEVRSVLDHLGRILGAVYTDDILDRLFSRFCIGK